MFFSRKHQVQPPYDLLSEEQRHALYFLLDYLGYRVTDKKWNYIKKDAYNYLEKAIWYFGMTKQQVQELRPHYKSWDKIIELVKTINNKQALNYMVNNCYNLIILIEDYDQRELMMNQFYDLWAELGYSYNDVRLLINKYMYRTDI